MWLTHHSAGPRRPTIPAASERFPASWTDSCKACVLLMPVGLYSSASTRVSRRPRLGLQACCLLLFVGAAVLSLRAAFSALQRSSLGPTLSDIWEAEELRPKVTIDDLVIAIPTDDQHLPLITASRPWRQGIRTLLAVNSSVVVEHEADFKADGEYWRYYPDDSPHRGLHAGDTRAAVAPYLAHHVFGDTYKWLLYGDDDTMWFIEGVLKLAQTLDHELPYFITDNLWWSSTENVIGGHPNPEAPRCLPCGFTVPEGAWKPFDAPPGCPCTPRLLCQYDQRGVLEPDCDIPLHPKRTYSMHGGAGGLLSIGLLRVLTLEAMEACIAKEQHAPGGDAFSTICLWREGFAHTDPGLYFSNPHVHMFDPLNGDGTFMLSALQNATRGIPDEVPKEILDNMVSAHIRSRTSSIQEASALQVGVATAYRDYVGLDSSVGKSIR